MAQVGDILEFVDEQTGGNSDVRALNVYHFEVLSIPSGIALDLVNEFLLSWWYDSFLQPVIAVQSAGIVHTQCTVNNLMSYETDFTVLIPEAPLPGSVASEFSGNALAWSFMLQRQTRQTRNGYKRFFGVPELWVQNNGVAAAATEDLSTLQTHLAQSQIIPIGVAGDIGVVPRIVRKAPTVSLPPLAVNGVQSAVFRGLGSQNTRKALLP